jgi:hypothetical protein
MDDCEVVAESKEQIPHVTAPATMKLNRNVSRKYYK